MFCTNCGFQFQGSFCPECGTPAAKLAAEPSPSAPGAPLSAASPVPSPAPPSRLSAAGMAKICPNCGDMLLAQAKTCPTCGCKQLLSVDKSDTEKIQQIRSGPSCPEVNLTPPKKVSAPFPPSKKQLAKQRIAENKANAVACCPKCGSTSLSANKKGFGIGKAILGATIIGKYGLTAGKLHAQKVVVTCLNCGHQWKP